MAPVHLQNQDAWIKYFRRVDCEWKGCARTFFNLFMVKAYTAEIFHTHNNSANVQGDERITVV